MSETLTVDATPQAEVVGEAEGVQLTAEEQDSLNVGQELADSQETLLAGKYKDAESLEKAYIELQKKLGEDGQNNQAEDQQEEVLSETSEKDTPTYSEGAQLISDASDEYYSNEGNLSEETLNKFSSMSSQDLVKAYMEVQKNNPQQMGETADISDATVNEVKNFAGGEQQYANMVDWASNNLDAQSIQAFDNVVNNGNVDAIKFAVNGLKAQYEAANGYEGTMVTGKAPTNNRDVFRSQAELVAAMNDRRYDNDPAYRQDVIAKLDRSDNLEF